MTINNNIDRTGGSLWYYTHSCRIIRTVSPLTMTDTAPITTSSPAEPARILFAFSMGTDAVPRTTSGAPVAVGASGLRLGTSVAAFLEPAAVSAVVPSSDASPGISLAVSPEWAAAPVGASFNAAANPLVAAGSSAPLPPQGSFEKLPLLC